VALVLGLALRARLCAILALVLVAGTAHREAADVAGGEELPVRRRAHAVAADLAHLPGPVLPRIRSAAAAAAVHGARADHSHRPPIRVRLRNWTPAGSPHSSASSDPGRANPRVSAPNRPRVRATTEGSPQAPVVAAALAPSGSD